MNYWRIGGLAATGQAAAYVGFLMLVVVHPGTEPLLLAIDLLSIAFGILPLLVLVGLVQRITNISASECYLMFGFIVVNTALRLAAAAIDSAGLPRFLQLYTQHPDEAQSGYQVLGTVTLQLGTPGTSTVPAGAPHRPGY